MGSSSRSMTVLFRVSMAAISEFLGVSGWVESLGWVEVSGWLRGMLASFVCLVCIVKVFSVGRVITLNTPTKYPDVKPISKNINIGSRELVDFLFLLIDFLFVFVDILFLLIDFFVVFVGFLFLLIDFLFDVGLFLFGIWILI